jgi:hypothetical protein
MSRESPLAPLFWRSFVTLSTSSYLHSWAAALFDHFGLSRFETVCLWAAFPSGIAAAVCAVCWVVQLENEASR